MAFGGSFVGLRRDFAWQARQNCRGVVPGNFAHQAVPRNVRSAPAWRARS